MKRRNGLPIPPLPASDIKKRNLLPTPTKTRLIVNDASRLHSYNFKKLIEPRIDNVLESMRIISHLTNRYAYRSTKDEVEMFLNKIQHRLNELRKEFEESGIY